MGLTKQYLRFLPASTFSVVTNPDCNAVLLGAASNGSCQIATGTCETITIWELRTLQKIRVLDSEKPGVAVTRLHRITQDELAAGFSDGSVVIFHTRSGEQRVSLQGHRSAVTAMTYDPDTMSLITGSKDTHIIIWDVVAECGRMRLKGHSGMITRLQLMTTKHVLVSSSKDCLVKLWDLDSYRCFQTIAGNQTEVWDFCIVKNDSWIVTGSSDPFLKVWNVSSPGAEEVEEIGSLDRFNRSQRVTGLTLVPGTQFMIVHGASKQADVYWVTTDEEKQRRRAKRLKKAVKQGAVAPEESLRDEFILLPISLAPLHPADSNEGDRKRKRKKIKSFFFPSSPEEAAMFSHDRRPCFVDSKEESSKGERDKRDLAVSPSGHQLDCLALFSDNTLGRMRFQYCRNVPHQPELRDAVLPLPGHSTDIRALGFSSDGVGLFSASRECLRVWTALNREPVCVRRLPTREALCGLFVPGDRHIILGSRNGALSIYDVNAGEVLEEIEEAHGRQAIWSMTLLPSQEGIVTAGSDKTVKFWEFTILNENLGRKKPIGSADKEGSGSFGLLSLFHKRTLEVDDEALSVRISSDNRFLVVALLDCTVKIFFVDTLKFFLHLYGHSLPVTCLDITSDTSLIATGGGDKNVKIWGTDFGDCHKSIFAHDDGILGLQFLPKTHMFFTCGKDGKVKQWDADNFQRITTLVGHLGPVWALSVSGDGRRVASASSDRSIRLWEKSSEILILEDEREEEREKEDEALATGGASVLAGERNTEIALPAKRTLDSELGAERLMEALEAVAAAEENPEASGMVVGVPLPPMEFLLEVLCKIRSSELEETLLVLPLRPYVEDLLKALVSLFRRGKQIELLIRVMVFLIRCNYSVLTTLTPLLPTLKQLSLIAKEKQMELRDVGLRNVCGLKCLQSALEAQSGVSLFQEALQTTRKKRKKKSKMVRSSQVAVLHV